jgi:hypothetical protein
MSGRNEVEARNFKFQNLRIKEGSNSKVKGITDIGS